MLNDLVKKSKNYEGCTATFDEAKVVLYGAGFDGTSSYRPGSRFAPMAIRSETYFSQEDYSPYFNRDLNQHAVHDLGDVEVLHGDTIKTMERIEVVSEYLVSHQKKPVCPLRIAIMWKLLIQRVRLPQPTRWEKSVLSGQTRLCFSSIGITRKRPPKNLWAGG